MARENPTWGYRRSTANSPDSAATLPRPSSGRREDRGHRPGPAAIGTDLAAVPPAQAHAILAVHFAHVDTVFLHRLYVLVMIEHGRRHVYRRDHRSACYWAATCLFDNPSAQANTIFERTANACAVFARRDQRLTAPARPRCTSPAFGRPGPLAIDQAVAAVPSEPLAPHPTVIVVLAQDKC
jgi:hypothetical protein